MIRNCLNRLFGTVLAIVLIVVAALALIVIPALA